MRDELKFITSETDQELRARDKNAISRPISAHYSSNDILNDYVGFPVSVRDYWMHGWYPAYFNSEPRLIAGIKSAGSENPAEFEAHKLTHFQWVGREDQAVALREDGFRLAEAIGLPFAYLPALETRRHPGSLLVMPPHGLKKYFSPELARKYAAEIAALKSRFSQIYACVAMRDFYRGEWRAQFEEVGIPVFYGAGPNDENTLVRMKEIFQTFEFVTTNSFGSQLAYAAHCGAKVSVYGPYLEWPKTRQNFATRLFPDLSDTLVSFLSEETMRAHYPFLFVDPDEALARQAWGDWEIGLQHRRTAAELRVLFGETAQDGQKSRGVLGRAKSMFNRILR